MTDRAEVDDMKRSGRDVREDGKAKLITKRYNLQSGVHDLDNDNVSIREQLERIDELESLNQSLEEEVQSLKTINGENGKTIASILGDDSEETGDVVLRKTVWETKERLKAVERENSQLKQQLSDVGATRDEQAGCRVMTEREAVIPDLERESRMMTHKAHSLGWQNARLVMEIDQLKSEKRELEGEVDRCKFVVQDATRSVTENSELTSAVEELSTELATERKRAEDLDNKVHELSSTNLRLERTLRERASHVQERDNMIERLEVQVSELNESMKVSERSFSDVLRKCKDYEIAFVRTDASFYDQEQQIEQLRHECDTLTLANEQLSADVKRARSDSASKSANKSQLEEALEYAKSEIRSRDSTIASFAQVDATTRKQLDAFSSKIHEYQQQIRDLSTDNRRADTDIASLNETIKGLEDELDEARDSTQQKSRTTKQMKYVIQTEERAKTSLENHLCQVKMSLQDARDEVGDLQGKLASAAEEAKDMFRELERAKSAETRALLKISKLTKKLDLHKITFRESTAKQKQLNAELRNELLIVQQKLESIEAESENRASQVAVKDQRLLVLAQNNDIHVNEIEAEKQQMYIESGDLRAQLAITRDSQTAFLEKMGEIGKCNTFADAFAVSLELKRRNGQLESEIRDLRGIFGIGETDSISIAATELKRTSNRMKRIGNALNEIVPGGPANIVDRVRETNEACERLTRVFEKLRVSLHTDQIVGKVLEMKEYCKRLASRETTLRKIVPGYNYEMLPQYVKRMATVLDDVESRERRLMAILDVQTPDVITERVSRLLAELGHVMELTSELSGAKGAKRSDVLAMLSQLHDDYESTKTREKAILAALPADIEGTIDQQVSYIVYQNTELSRQIECINNTLPDSITGDVVSRVRVIVGQYESRLDAMRTD